ELGMAERQTTALVARRLEAVGLRPRLLSMGTGLTCDVGAGDGPTVALRADLDALPLQDEKDVPYRSTVPGVCHACGHDVHTTILLGVGLALAQLADRLPGRVRLVFPPAEECLARGAGGALAGPVGPSTSSPTGCWKGSAPSTPCTATPSWRSAGSASGSGPSPPPPTWSRSTRQ